LRFLGQAKKLFKGLATEPEVKAERFNVKCVSGHRVRGERTEGYQALRCPACGEGVFVLPRSPLPYPSPPKRAEGSKSARAVERMVDDDPVELSDPASVSVDLGGDEHALADADIVWDDALPEPEPAPPVVAPKSLLSPTGSVDLGIAGPPDAGAGANAKGKTTLPGAEARGHRQGGRPPKQRTASQAPGHRDRDDAARDDRASRRPQAAAAHGGTGNGQGELVLEIKPASRYRALNRWLLVLVPIVVIATVAWRIRDHVRQQYPLIAEKGKTEGIPALEAGEFDKAHQILSAAKSAVVALGGDVRDADDIRQAADEAAIFINLIPVDLGELLEEAGHADTPDEWDSRFDRLYKGRSVLVSTIVTAVPDGSASSKYEIATRILPPGESGARDGRPARVGEFDLKGFQLFEQAGLPKELQVTFGAKLESFKYDLDSKTWFIRFMPKSGVFIMHTKALDSLGWQIDSIPIAEEPKEDGR
jgi:DNA-directed RNA polymerase subunit RPC12/RpoP